MHTYPITIRHIFISPGHNYFGRPKDGPGPHPTLDVEQAEAVTGQGLRGDRYFGVAAHYDAQITFVAWEVFSALRDELGIPDASPSLMRRNVVVEGVPLNQLIGQPFQLDFGTHVVDFAGAKHCAPCAWMNAMLAPDAQQFLRGRGGLRARILSDGLIVRGPARLHTEIPLNLDIRLEPLARPRLP